MVFPHIPLHNLYVPGLAYLSRQFAHPHRHRPDENRFAILRDPFQTVLDVVFGVTGRPVLLYTDILPEGVT
jgi:hypothetical protein